MDAAGQDGRESGGKLEIREGSNMEKERKSELVREPSISDDHKIGIFYPLPCPQNLFSVRPLSAKFYSLSAYIWCFFILYLLLIGRHIWMDTLYPMFSSAQSGARW